MRSSSLRRRSSLRVGRARLMRPLISTRPTLGFLPQNSVLPHNFRVASDRPTKKTMIKATMKEFIPASIAS